MPGSAAAAFVTSQVGEVKQYIFFTHALHQAAGLLACVC